MKHAAPLDLSDPAVAEGRITKVTLEPGPGLLVKTLDGTVVRHLSTYREIRALAGVAPDDVLSTRAVQAALLDRRVLVRREPGAISEASAMQLHGADDRKASKHHRWHALARQEG